MQALCPVLLIFINHFQSSFAAITVYKRVNDRNLAHTFSLDGHCHQIISRAVETKVHYWLLPLLKQLNACADQAVLNCTINFFVPVILRCEFLTSQSQLQVLKQLVFQVKLKRGCELLEFIKVLEKVPHVQALGFDRAIPLQNNALRIEIGELLTSSMICQSSQMTSLQSTDLSTLENTQVSTSFRLWSSFVKLFKIICAVPNQNVPANIFVRYLASFSWLFVSKVVRSNFTSCIRFAWRRDIVRAVSIYRSQMSIKL